ncbi:unnamed protein product [Ectocarpus sp. 4 AP-2014]
MCMLCARRTQLIQRRRCVTCVSPALLVDSAATRVCDVPSAACPIQRGACVLAHSRWLWDTAVESLDLKSRQLVITRVEN